MIGTKGGRPLRLIAHGRDTSVLAAGFLVASVVAVAMPYTALLVDVALAGLGTRTGSRQSDLLLVPLGDYRQR